MFALLTRPKTYAIAAVSVVVVLWSVLIGLPTSLLWRLRKGEGSGADCTLMFPLIRWDGAFQRPQHLAQGLARDGRVIYVDPLPAHWVIRDLGYALRSILWTQPSGVVVTKPWTLPGENQSRLIRRFNRFQITQWCRLLLEGCGRPVVYTHLPTSADLIGQFRERLFVYDIIDDFTAASWASPRDIAEEKDLLRRCDLVVTGTHELLLRKCGDDPKARFIACGAEYAHFAGGGPRPASIDGLEGPVIGYFGVINERINGDLLLEMARRHPDWQIVLIGPVHNDFPLATFDDRWSTVVDDPRSRQFKLREHPSNLHFPGLMPYRDLPGALAAFDVAILPYRRTPVTEIIHPVKLLEYLAGGKPVVCTALPDVERYYAEVISIASSDEAFIAHVEDAVTRPNLERIEAGRALAKHLSWGAMVDEFREAFAAAGESRE